MEYREVLLRWYRAGLEDTFEQPPFGKKIAVVDLQSKPQPPQRKIVLARQIHLRLQYWPLARLSLDAGGLG